MDLNASEQQRELYLSPADADGYRRDQSVFGDGINIEDDMAVLVRYANGAKMSYHLTAYSPWEGFRVAFNGTKGRLELECIERGQTELPDNAEGGGSVKEPSFDAGSVYDTPSESTLTVQLHWQKAVKVEIPGDRDPGHGGGDQRLLDDIFIGGLKDPLGRAADHVGGAQSILTGAISMIPIDVYLTFICFDAYRYCCQHCVCDGPPRVRAGSCGLPGRPGADEGDRDGAARGGRGGDG